MGICVVVNPSILIGCLSVFLSLWVMKRFASPLNLLDHPGGRKMHSMPTPVIGGIALFTGFTITLLCNWDLFYSVRIMWFCSLIILLVGVIDDRHDVSARTRLMVQALAALCLIVLSDTKLQHLGDFFFNMPVASYWVAIDLTVLVIMAFINAMNMLDGVDGLVGGIALGQGTLLWVLSASLVSNVHAILSIFLCLLPIFLIFNTPLPYGKPARIFLGDAGSTFIAFLLIWAGITLSQHELVSNVKPITVLWCLLFPFMDLLSVCIIRFFDGKSCFQAGHEHIHHILIRSGTPRPCVSLALSVLSFGIGLIGVALAWGNVVEDIQLMLMLTVVVIYVVATYHAYQFVSSESSDDVSPA
jgi:undecaprenyl-phosphate alpha-N-acetylglucosaminyl 1-phosphatetransferase